MYLYDIGNKDVPSISQVSGEEVEGRYFKKYFFN